MGATEAARFPIPSARWFEAEQGRTAGSWRTTFGREDDDEPKAATMTVAARAERGLV